MHRAVQIALAIQAKGFKLVKDFEVELKKSPEVTQLKIDVRTFVTQFPMPGFDVATLKYKHIEG